MNIKSALEKIYSMHQFSIKLGLERVENLLDHIDRPQEKLRCFHIAGSNGKGSTASFIASILMETGFKVGLYTSPHFVRFNERIKINGVEIDDEYIAGFIESMDEYIDEFSPTFFEITTALAFKYFAENEVDFAVIETGLGGRLDATNVIHPLASIITSISLEHTNILGDTIEKIAVEKAGIIKPKTLVLNGFMPTEAENIIVSKALGAGCRHIKAGDFITREDDYINVQLRKKVFKIYSTPLAGKHQLNNCALALKTINEFLGIDEIDIFTKGINNVVKNTGIQGRYEVINNFPKIIFDSAHNPEGIESFIREFEKEYKNYSERTLIFGAMRDKDIDEMLRLLIPYFDVIYVSQVQVERAAPIDQIIELMQGNNKNIVPLEDPSGFIRKFQLLNENKCLVVLGSMYLVGEIKSKII
jgi:dihydrofolate synthase / folylpolyglutamate synthase